MFLRVDDRQFVFWNLRRGGLSNTAIADHFTISRQAVSRALLTMDRKVGDLLCSMAEANGIEVLRLDPALGVLIGRSVPLGVDAVIFVSETHGVQVWYEHEGDCAACARHDECMILLRDFAREMDISLIENGNPTEMADEIFRKVKELV
ncbi:hypothetical protein RJ40_11175 [Methanofollis aquaemaris]|uniref:Uncharacterized protein n=1 Tax=Methanofollis aquaemaris TaxID=126734 RepID=A0A8A3S7A1_9EURY|nr:hypothetical protein [Methanofollis aquaemaris]QSZ68015.1 hypothetical protein RJ40_11175 [Methanofollis aquaemaris]